MVITLELDPTAREDSVEHHGDEPPVSLLEIEASVKRVLGADVPLRPVSPDAPLDLRRFYGINSRIASRYLPCLISAIERYASARSTSGLAGPYFLE